MMTTTAPLTTSLPLEEQLGVSTTEAEAEEEFLDIYDDDSPLGGRVIVVAPSPKSTMNYEGCEDKATDIRECLQMHSESCCNTVDLWELRQLAVSTGGLLSPSLRQVAWPLLTGVSMSALEEEAAATSISSSVDENTAEKMQKDIETTIWNLEESVRQSQTGKESFWYAPLLQATGGSGSSLADAPSMVPLSSPCSSSEISQTESLTTNNSPLKAAKPSSTTTTDTAAAGPSPQDQILLKKVLTKALKGQTEYPVAGLANLAALFMINMESTSLSSLLLKRLTTYPLKAALGGANDDDSDNSDVSKVQAMVKCLLEEFHQSQTSRVDDDVIQSKTEEALAWFSGSQTSSLQAASRLMDVFLVSHPLFPLYIAAAAVETTSTPLSWNMEKIEELITQALEYMEKFPPSQLMKATNATSILPPTPSWAVAATVTADWVPSEFHNHESIVAGDPSSTSEEHEARQQVEPFSDEDSSSDWERISATSQADIDDVDNDNDKDTVQSVPTRETLFHESYPLAMTAAGLGLPSSVSAKSRSLTLPPPPEMSAKGSKRYMKLAFLVTAIVAVLVAAWSQPASYGNVSPVASLIKGPLPSPASVPLPRPHKEKFLGLVPVERPAPKKVLRTSRKMMVAPTHPMEQRRAMATSAKPNNNNKTQKPAKGTTQGLLPARQMLGASDKKIAMAPSTVPLAAKVEQVAPPPKAAPSDAAVEPAVIKTATKEPPKSLVPSSPPKKLTFMVNKDIVKKPANATTSTPPEAEQQLHKYIMEGLQMNVNLEETTSSIKKTLQSWSSTAKLFESVEEQQQIAAEAPVRKFQPFRPIKMQLKKVGKMWSKVVTFVRRRVGRGKKETR